MHAQLSQKTTPGIWLCCPGSLHTEGQEEPSKNLHVRWYQSTGILDMRIYWSWWVYLHLNTVYKITHGLCHFPTGIFTPRQFPHNFRMNSFQLFQPFAKKLTLFSSLSSLEPFPYGTHFTLNMLLVHILSLSFTIDRNVFVLVLLLLRWL